MDPYRILGVTKDCTRGEVKEAFRARARSPIRIAAGRTSLSSSFAPHTNRFWWSWIGGQNGDLTSIGPREHLQRMATSGDAIRQIMSEDRREEMPFFERTPQSPDPIAMREAYLAWLHRVSANSSRSASPALTNFGALRVAKLGSRVLILRTTWQFYCVLIFAVLGLIYLTVTVLDPQAKARTLGWQDGSLTGVFWSAIVLCSLLLACWIAFKADPT